jgi:hypothetical protein
MQARDPSWQTVRLALLSSAVVLPFSHPALAQERYAFDASEAAALSAIDVMGGWQLPPFSPWAPYQKETLLSALGAGQVTSLPDVEHMDSVALAIPAAATLGASGLPPDTLWMIDLPGAASVAFAATLSHTARESVAPVLTFNNWPFPNELIPAEETLAALVRWQPTRESDPTNARAVFVMDAWRLVWPEVEVADDRTDNRYMLGPADLPDVATLARQGITRVVYVVEARDDQPMEQDDLNATFLEYQASGIDLAMVDLRELREPTHLTALEWFHHHAYTARYRPTIVSDPLFYARSQGGFGGIFASGHGSGG